MNTFEKALERGREAGARVPEHVIDLLELAAVGRVVARLRLCAARLALEEVHVDTADRLDVHPLPDRDAAAIKGMRGRLHDLLAVEAVGVCVGDVVPGRDEARMSHAQSG